MNWKQYRKGIAALVGLLAILGARYGFNLSDDQQGAVVDLVLAVVTVASVIWLPNHPGEAAPPAATEAPPAPPAARASPSKEA